MRVAVTLLALAFVGLSACEESDQPPAAKSDAPPSNVAFGDATEQDSAGFAEIGRAMSAFAHEYAAYARHAKRNNLSSAAKSLDRMVAAADRAERVSFDSTEARREVEAYLHSLRRLARSNARLVRLARRPNSRDEAMIDLLDVIGEAAVAAQRANRKLGNRVLDTVAGDTRRELADAFGRVRTQLLRETDPEAYRRAVRSANDGGS